MTMTRWCLALAIGTYVLLPGCGGSSSPTNAAPDLATSDTATTTTGGATATVDALDAGPAISGPAFALGTTGCPMAHCSPYEDDYNPAPAPRAIATSWHDRNAGSAIGLGCASNGTVAVCSLVGSPAVQAYDASGKHLWDSKTLLDSNAFASAPMVDTEGGAIAADDKTIIYFDSSGTPKWSTATPGGTPISPVPLPNGLVVLATKATTATVDGGSVPSAPISSYDATTGAPGPRLDLTDTDATGSYIWETVNTPSSQGSRIYVSMQRTSLSGATDPLSKGALVAIDVTPTAMTKRWSFEFEGPSASSPMMAGGTIYFDGAGVHPDGTKQAPVFFGLHDAGDHAALLWTHTMTSQPNCNAAHDPRGGVWVFGKNDAYLDRLAEGAPDGCGTGACEPAILQQLDFPTIFSDRRATPRPTISLGSTASAAPQMIIGANLTASTPVTDIDLLTGTVKWTYAPPEGGASVGQYPILTPAGSPPVIVYTTIAGGTFGLVGSP